jgi:hypothetical protein
MEPNYHAGWSYGAWSSKKTLVNHGLLQKNQTTNRRVTGESTLILTDNGKLFIKALLRKFPQSTKNPGDAYEKDVHGSTAKTFSLDDVVLEANSRSFKFQ